ncbi:MAG: hypothetical protein ACRDIU_10170 [Actinomycetota bacterium]
MAGRTRRGPPSAGRQRAGLRIVQVTMLIMAGFLSALAYVAWFSNGPRETGEAVALSLLAAGFVAAAARIGLTTVRGLQPPSPD